MEQFYIVLRFAGGAFLALSVGGLARHFASRKQNALTLSLFALFVAAIFVGAKLTEWGGHDVIYYQAYHLVAVPVFALLGSFLLSERGPRLYRPHLLLAFYSLVASYLLAALMLMTSVKVF